MIFKTIILLLMSFVKVGGMYWSKDEEYNQKQELLKIARCLCFNMNKAESRISSSPFSNNVFLSQNFGQTKICIEQNRDIYRIFFYMQKNERPMVSPRMTFSEVIAYLSPTLE